MNAETHRYREAFVGGTVKPTAELTEIPAITKLLRWAQRRSEAHDRRNRDSVLKQDDWIDKHLPGVG